MPYCALADIIDQVPEQKVIELTDDENTGQVNTSRVDKAIATAGSIIDGYLRGRYTLPLSTVPELIKTISIDISVFKLYERRREMDMPESLTNRYKNAVKLLEQIQKGLISLGIEAEASAAGSAGSYKTNKTADDREFTKEKLKTF
ncbi:MAG: mu-like prophage Flumu protein gp36 [Nitrospirae bacterium]|nr:MAG: mu-like prophage Flumu protein gp36 [Nitrospirota bacterium]